LEYRVYEGAFSTAARRVWHGEWFALSGCLYESSGRKIVATERLGGSPKDMIVGDNPAFLPPPASASRLTGTTLLLSPLFNHYGHVLIETMSRLWFLDQKQYVHRIAFFPTSPEIGIATFVRNLIEPFGIRSLHRLVEPTVFDKVIVPDDAILPRLGAHPAMRSVFDKVISRYGSPPREYRLFLSRDNAPRNEGAIANAADIEDIARSEFGFDIVRPEDLPVPEQIARISSAAVLAGFSGSALHACLFMREGSTLIELGDGRSPKMSSHWQLVCTTLSRCAAYFVPLVESRPAVAEATAYRDAFAAILRDDRRNAGEGGRFKGRASRQYRRRSGSRRVRKGRGPG
jgi:capsular polysaccharide biosynthesis protein